MFGYAIASLDDLDEAQKDRYKGVYCGLCHKLGELHGQISRFGLTYDITFLILLLSSLYEPKEVYGREKCMVHPAKKHSVYQNLYTDYGADMTIALTFHKCMDDWMDDKKAGKRIYAAMLGRQYKKVREKWPRQCEAIEKSIADLSDIEREKGSVDAAANTFGNLMEELFVYQSDLWEQPLREFARWLGRFIYVMDAAMDFDEDKKKGSYNPLVLMNMLPKESRSLMTIMIGRAAEVFERLPLEQDLHLLRSVIYAGVWQKFNAKYEKEETG